MSEPTPNTFAERMQRIETLLVNLHEKVDNLSRSIADHDAALYGGGDKSGLIGRVEALERALERQAKFNERALTVAFGISGTVGTYLLLRLLGLIAP